MMTELEAIEARHSVRQYKDIPVPEDVRAQLKAFTDEVNAESGLNIQVRFDEPEGFDSRLAHYGKFTNVNNYILLAGKKTEDFEFRCGYYGEKIVLRAQQLGLNTCWTALTYNRKHGRKILPPGEALCMVIALGIGETQGVSRHSKKYEDVAAVPTGFDGGPDWFKEGIAAALKAPTAINQQKFFFTLDGGEVTARVKGIGSNTKVDLGIAVYHFEAATGRKVKV